MKQLSVIRLRRAAYRRIIDRLFDNSKQLIKKQRFLFFVFRYSLPKFFISYLISHISYLNVTAQTLQVITKTVERSFDLKGIEAVSFQAERADVEVLVWGRPEIKIMVELTAKHPDRATATADIENLKYGIEQVSKTLYCRNYLLISKTTPKPQANLKVRFVVLMPASCALNVQNSFGKIHIKGLTKETTLNTDFCSTDLVDMTGKITISTHFGELRLTDIDAKITLTTDHSDLWLKQIKGQCDIRAQNGSIELNIDKTALKLNLKTNKTEVRYAAAQSIVNSQ